MSTFLGIVIAAVSVFTLAVVVWAFIWAAKKDGEAGASTSTATAATAVISPPSPTVAATSAQHPVRTPSSRRVRYAASTFSNPTNGDSFSSSDPDESTSGADDAKPA